MAMIRFLESLFHMVPYAFECHLEENNTGAMYIRIQQSKMVTPLHFCGLIFQLPHACLSLLLSRMEKCDTLTSTGRIILFSTTVMRSAHG
jgi:hypothetical protein